MASPQASGEALLSDLDNTHYVTVVWKPPISHPVAVYYVKVNGIELPLAHSNGADSPKMYAIPPPMLGKSVTISWFVAPRVTVDGIAIAISTPGAGPPQLVKPMTDPSKCARGGTWHDDAQVQL